VAYSKSFTDRGFSYLVNGRGCRKLTHLDISGCTQLTPVGFDAISDAFRELEVNKKSIPKKFEILYFNFLEFSDG
jgi:hypothetical protein